MDLSQFITAKNLLVLAVMIIFVLGAYFKGYVDGVYLGVSAVTEPIVRVLSAPLDPRLNFTKCWALNLTTMTPNAVNGT